VAVAVTTTAPPATATAGAGESRASKATGREAAASNAALRALATRTARSATEEDASRSDRSRTGPSRVDTNTWSESNATGAAKKRGMKTEVEGRTSVNETAPEDVPPRAFTTTGTGVWLPVAAAAGATVL